MRSMKWMAIAGVFALGAVGTVVAGGAPQVDPLVYSGTLTDSLGAPLTTPQMLTLRLFNASTGGTADCTAGPTSVTPDALGRFSVTLATCVAEVRSSPDRFLEVQVGSQVLPRARLNAVPFALEADHATAADVARKTVIAPRPLPDGGLTRAVSTSGLYCGSTPSTTGAAGGHAGVKVLCEGACSSPSAHFCTTQEAATSVAVGLALPIGWVTGGYTALGTATESYDDCRGFTVANFGEYGPRWVAPGRVSGDYCSVSNPYLCCD